MPSLNQKQIEDYIRDNCEIDLIEWANLMKYVRTKVRYGEIKLVIHNGRVKRIEKVTEYYQPENDI